MLFYVSLLIYTHYNLIQYLLSYNTMIYVANYKL